MINTATDNITSGLLMLLAIGAFMKELRGGRRSKDSLSLIYKISRWGLFVMTVSTKEKKIFDVVRGSVKFSDEGFTYGHSNEASYTFEQMRDLDSAISIVVVGNVLSLTCYKSDLCCFQNFVHHLTIHQISLPKYLGLPRLRNFSPESRLWSLSKEWSPRKTHCRLNKRPQNCLFQKEFLGMRFSRLNWLNSIFHSSIVIRWGQ